VIRPCQLGDLLLVQRLGGQATKLNAIQALLQPRVAAITSLSSIVPWFGARANTYILRQQRNSLAQSGFIQTQERIGRPEADITLLAPALDTPRGHPAIWEKLLAHYIHEAANRQIRRVYADVPDQPLPVKTFTQTGFRTYTSQTIWRLNLSDKPQYSYTQSSTQGKNESIRIRQQTAADIWALQKLYSKVTPKSVQRAEGFGQGNIRNGLISDDASDGTKTRALTASLRSNRSNGTNNVKLSMLDWWHVGYHSTFVLSDRDEIQGCILIGQGPRGTWLRLLVDTLNPNSGYIYALLGHGLNIAQNAAPQFPVYIGVRDYHGGMDSILNEYQFAPFTDRARMVRQVPVWARTTVPLHERMIDAVGEAIPTTFTLPNRKTITNRHITNHQIKTKQER